jgi:hypothetical protein
VLYPGDGIPVHIGDYVGLTIVLDAMENWKSLPCTEGLNRPPCSLLAIPSQLSRLLETLLLLVTVARQMASDAYLQLEDVKQSREGAVSTT